MNDTIAILETLCGCTRELSIGFARHILRIPIPNTYIRHDDGYVWCHRERPRERHFELREFQPATEHLKARAFYREIA